jgi:uncharacterized membrane protein
MSNTETNDRSDWPILAGATLLVLGLALVVMSLVLPNLSRGSSGWSEEKAESYQAASAELHRLSMQMAGIAAEDQTRARQDALAEAQTKYANLRAELDAARSRPARIATILRYAGIFLAAAGTLLLWNAREKTSSNA